MDFDEMLKTTDNIHVKQLILSMKQSIEAAEVIRQDLIVNQEELKIIVGTKLDPPMARFRIWCKGTAHGLSIAKIVGSPYYAETAIICISEPDKKEDSSFENTNADFSTIRTHRTHKDLIKEINRVRNI